MAEEAQAPSPAFSGIDFNPAFFPGTTSEYVEFPTAQGTVTFGSIFATDIDTPTPSVDFDLLSSETGNINIGASVLAGNTIKIGASTGTSVHCGSVDFKGTHINNAVSATTGDVSLCNNQTTGALYIGSHPTVPTRTTGGINIGSNSVGVTQIVIGTTGQSTTALNGSSVNVGTKITSPVYDSTSATTAMTIGANVSTTSISIGESQTTGTLNIGTSALRTTGPINIGTSTIGNNAITIGTTGQSTIALNGTSTNVTTKLTCPVYDSTTATTALTVGSNLQSASLTIANSLTSGDIFIGCGTVRTSASDISIGTGANASGNILIGHQGTTSSTQLVKINTSTTASVGQTTIGSSTSATNIGGALNVTGLVTADGGLTLNTGDLLTATGGIKTTSIDVPTSSDALNIGNSQASSTIVIGSGKTSGYIQIGGGNTNNSVIIKPYLDLENDIRMGNGIGIRLSATSYTPSTLQLGYAVEYTNGHTTVGTTSTSLATTGSTIAIGRYLVIVTWMCDTWSLATINLTLTLTATNGTANILLGAFGPSTATGGYVNGSVSGYATITTTSGTLALTGLTSAGTVSCKNNIKLIRVA
jgi:hypothetical protein